MSFLFYVPQMASYGGMEQHVCLLARLLAKNGHKVTLLTTSNSLNDATRVELLKSEICLRELPIARGEASKVKKLVWLLQSALRLRSRRWKLIYTNGQSSLARMVWVAAKGCSRIAHHHHTSGDWEEQKTWHPAFRRTLVAAPELVACSQSTRRQLEATLGRYDVRFLPYLTPKILPASAVTERSHRLDKPLNFGFAGRLVQTKGIDMICALSHDTALAEVRWHIYGSGVDYPAAFFQPHPNVQYHGPFYGPIENAILLQKLDALALFSQHNEGMPLSLIEGMSAGLPWIATDQGGTSELAMAPDNCEIVPLQASFDEIRSRTLALATRIRSGITSRRTQRGVYDTSFAPEIVAERWLEFIRCPRAA